MTKQEALKQVLEDMKKLSPDEFKRELEKNKAGELAIALQETSEFLEKLINKKR